MQEMFQMCECAVFVSLCECEWRTNYNKYALKKQNEIVWNEIIRTQLKRLRNSNSDKCSRIKRSNSNAIFFWAFCKVARCQLCMMYVRCFNCSKRLNVRLEANCRWRDCPLLGKIKHLFSQMKTIHSQRIWCDSEHRHTRTSALVTYKQSTNSRWKTLWIHEKSSNRIRMNHELYFDN